MEKEQLVGTIYDILNNLYYEDVDGVHFNYPQTVNKIVELVDKCKEEYREELTYSIINSINSMEGYK